MTDLAPDAAALDRLARRAFDALPEEVRQACASVLVRVEEMPSDAQLDSVGMENEWELTGLYDGTPLIDRSHLDVEPRQDVVWLFRRPILLEWIERGDVGLAELVTHVLVHELAHHLGWSDEDIARIDRWWE